MNTVEDRVVQYANRYILTNVDTGAELGTYDLTPVTGTISSEGTEINAELFDSIAEDLDAKVEASGGETGNTVATFSTLSGTQSNIASGNTTATLWGKVQNWFSRLGTLAFKSTITNSDISSTAAISASKISGLDISGYVSSVARNTSTGGLTVTYAEGATSTIAAAEASTTHRGGIIVSEDSVVTSDSSVGTYPYYKLGATSNGLGYAYVPQVVTSVNDSSTTGKAIYAPTSATMSGTGKSSFMSYVTTPLATFELTTTATVTNLNNYHFLLIVGGQEKTYGYNTVFIPTSAALNFHTSTDTALTVSGGAVSIESADGTYYTVPITYGKVYFSSATTIGCVRSSGTLYVYGGTFNFA